MASIFPARRFLLNGTSSNVAVNGSVTPVQFTLQPAAGTLFTAYELILNAYGTGNINDPTQFWSFAALPNGLASQISLNNVVMTGAGIIKNNFDMIQFLGGEFLGKTMGNFNIIRGQFDMTPALTLNGNRGDFFRIIVNDDLTIGGAIGQLNIALRGSVITF